jgi:hypothetical protein
VLTIEADLTFTASIVGQSRERAGGQSRGRRTAGPAAIGGVSGRVRADGSVVSMQFSRLPSLATPTAGSWGRAVADQLDREGVTVQVLGPDRTVVVELGHGVRAPRWQRLLTRSRLIRIRSLRSCFRSLRGPRLLEMALPRRASLNLAPVPSRPA